MTVPQVPTDNLYKFAALSGLFCSIGILWLLDSKVEKIGLMISEGRLEASVLEIQSKDLEEQMKMAERAANRDAFSDSELRRIQKLSTDLKIGVEKVGHEKARIKKLNSRIIKTFAMWLALSFIAGAYSLWGFRRWHLRVQLPNDQLLQKKLAQTNLTDG